MTLPSRRHAARLARTALTALAALALPGGAALAQVTLKPDGQWRHLLTAGLNLNSGNTRTSALNLNLDSVRATDISKWSATAQALYASSAGQTTGERVSVTTQYNGDLEPWRSTFGFVQAAGVHDRPANIEERLGATTGLGAHLMRQGEAFWDVWAGVAVSQDRYVRPVEVNGSLRTRSTDSGLVLAQESSLRLSASTTLRQKLVLLPSLRDSKLVRTEFDGQVAVAVNERMNLSTGLRLRHTTRPPPGLRRLDAALVTGLSVRFD